jgi:hypothetical protein
MFFYKSPLLSQKKNIHTTHNLFIKKMKHILKRRAFNKLCRYNDYQKILLKRRRRASVYLMISERFARVGLKVPYTIKRWYDDY